MINHQFTIVAATYICCSDMHLARGGPPRIYGVNMTLLTPLPGRGHARHIAKKRRHERVEEEYDTDMWFQREEG